MTVDQYFKERYVDNDKEPSYWDHDKQRFDSYDMVDFAEQYATQEKQGWVKFPENKPTIGSRPLWLFKNGDVEEIGYDGIGYRDATHFLLLPQKPEV